MIAALQPDRELHEYFTRTYWPRKLGGSPRTAKLYRLTFDRFRDWLGRSPRLSDLTDEAVCGFLQARMSEGLSAHTVAKERSTILALSQFAAKKRHISEFLDIPIVHPAAILPQCWRREHLEKLLQACRDTKGWIGKAPASVLWVAFHLLAILTGERTGALLALRWEWLDGRVLRVPAEARKGRKKPMLYRLSDTALHSLAELRKYTEETGLIFAVPWAREHHSGTFYRHYGKLLDRAGLPSGRRFKPQCLRRTFASFLEAAGGDATEALAHTDRKTTVKSYLDPAVTLEGQRSAADILEGELDLG